MSEKYFIENVARSGGMSILKVARLSEIDAIRKVCLYNRIVHEFDQLKATLLEISDLPIAGPEFQGEWQRRTNALRNEYDSISGPAARYFLSSRKIYKEGQVLHGISEGAVHMDTFQYSYTEN